MAGDTADRQERRLLDETPATPEPTCEPAIEREILELVDAYLSGAPGGRERLVPLLHRVQRQLGCLPLAVQQHVARRLRLSAAQVHEVASFYDAFTIRPRPRHRLKLCVGATCLLGGAMRVLDALREGLGIEVGGASRDRLFSLEEAHCLGVCGLAPVLLVNDETHGRLIPAGAKRLALWLREGTEQDPFQGRDT